MGQLMDWYNANQSGLGQMGTWLGNYAGAMQQQMCNPYQNQNYTTTTTTSFNAEEMSRILGGIQQRVAEPVKKVVKKTGKLLLDLRREIDEWHGDILMRAA